MQRDLRETSSFASAENLFRRALSPGTGAISDAADVNYSPDGSSILFTGTIKETLEDTQPSRICRLLLGSGEVTPLFGGGGNERIPKYSPDGSKIAYLSDRQSPGDYQLHLASPDGRNCRRLAIPSGWVEFHAWSPDGDRILLIIAGHGADVSGANGGIATPQSDTAPAWMPNVDTGSEEYKWRRLWIYDLVEDASTCLDLGDVNIWEAAWCGPSSIVVIGSKQPEEGGWYRSSLYKITLADCRLEQVHLLYEPQDQLGWVAGAPDGQRAAVVEAVASDRGFVAGDLRVIDSAGTVKQIDTDKIAVCHVEWRTEHKLLVAGVRGLSTAVAIYDTSTQELKMLWEGESQTIGNRYCAVSGTGGEGCCAFVLETFLTPPQIVTLGESGLESQLQLLPGLVEKPLVEANAITVAWTGSDGLELAGWLLQPSGTGPFPLVMDVHGGPVDHWRPRWLGRSGIHTLLLLQRGFAVFLPNPRGSNGRPQDIVRCVVGDMGGADADDLLRGIDHLVAWGLVDPSSLGVMGVSYGGYMSAWLVTQDQRFAAAAAIAPVTNFVTELLTSNVPWWPKLFIEGSYLDLNGQYYCRSPVLHADKVSSPTLIIFGGRDRSAPAGEAVQFYNALREFGTPCELAAYPLEGHGIRSLPAAIDYAARLATWFEQHLGTSNQRGLAHAH
jgi:dipeptidyl aminopeptidase/acylaminoacyl peptidase